MAIYGVRNKYLDCDSATIQIKKLKNKERQQEKANAVLEQLKKDGVLYDDDYYCYLLWEE